ncbi:MAG: phospholipase D family protein [Deltaproteobacteria bacterium]
MEVKYYTQPLDSIGNSFCLGIKLNEILKSQKPFYNRIWFVTSFAKLSGISKLKAAIKKSVKNKAVINFVLGTGKNLTTVETLNELQQMGCNVKIYRNNNGNSFGAKVYCFEAEGEKAEVFISSGNVTEGGLYKNHELIINVTYDLANGDNIIYSQFKDSISNYLEPSGANICEPSKEIIDMLLDLGEIVYESDVKSKTKTSTAKKKTGKEEMIEVDEPELVSIILPTGNSIEVSLNDSDDIEGVFETSAQVINKHSDKKEKKQKKEQLQKDDIDIEIVIEESERVEEFEHHKNSEEVNKEFAEEEYSRKNQESDISKKYEMDIHMESFNVIDIEQMLYQQQKGSEEADNSEPKRRTAISSDDIEFIKSQEEKRSSKKAKEKQIEKETESVQEKGRKKFIISSIANKNGTGIINAYFMHINKLKGKGISGEVRMPLAAREFSPEFWGWPSCYSISQGEGKNQKKSKKRQVKCRMLDTANPSDILIDTIELYQEEGKSNFNLISKMLISLEPEENDIIRLIRCAESDECIFQCELIRAGSEEYEIWDQFCSHIIKGTGRRYGFA